MIKYIRHAQIDKDKWNRCIREAQFATHFADYDMLSVACPRWNAIIKDDYDYVMPLPVRSKLSIRYIYTPFFLSRLGIFSSSDITAETVKEFIDCIPTAYKQIDLIFHPYNPAQLIEDAAIHLTSYTLDLHVPYCLLSPSYSDNTKRNLKTAAKHNLTYTTDCSVEQIISLFKKNRGKMRYVHYKNKDYKELKKLAYHALQHDFLDVVGVMDEEKHFLAGALFLKDRDRTWFWFSGRDNRFPEKRAMFFLVDEYIKRHANQNILLDFNGSMNENVARFYKGFHAVPYQYPMLCLTRHFYLNRLIKLYKQLTK